MLKPLICSALVLSLLSFAPKSVERTAEAGPSTQQDQPRGPGSVLALGSMEVFETALVDALGQGQSGAPSVIILPHASEEEDSGQEEKAAFEAMGITDVIIMKDLDTEGAKDMLQLASVVWFAQGSPRRLMQNLAANNLASFVQRLNSRGAIVGGAGRVAGALGIGYIEGNIKPPVMTSLSVMPHRGTGMWNGFIVPCMDEEDRMTMALTACLDQPNRPCIAFNHAASTRIDGDDMTFWGTGSTVFIDARKANKIPHDEGISHSIQDVKLHSFTEGEAFTWFQ